MSFFGAVLTTLVTLMHLYVFLRLDALHWRDRRISRKILIPLAVVLWLLFFIGREFGGNQHGIAGIALELAAMHWMGSLFLIAAAVFLADIASGFGFLLRARRNNILIAGFGLGLMLVALAHIQGLRPPSVRTYEIAVDNLPAELHGTTIAVMSDLHAGEMFIGPRWLSARIRQIVALNPDAIFLVGDLFERGANPAELVPVLRQLTAPLGVWAVRGNHDSLRPGRPDVAGEILSGAGIPILANEWIRLADGLLLAGIDDLTASRRRPSEGEANIEAALAGLRNEFTIFLSHTPWMMDRAAASGVGLMLSGHTHNGQIWPFNHLVATRYPCIDGRYDIGGMTLIVSRGTGTWGPRMRLWANGEITLITLQSKHEE